MWLKKMCGGIQSQSQKFLLRKEIYIEHQNILTAIHYQDWSVNLLSRSRQGRLLLEPFNINSTVICHSTIQCDIIGEVTGDVIGNWWLHKDQLHVPL